MCVALVLAFSYYSTGPRIKLSGWNASVDRARTACLDPDTGSVYIFPDDGTVVSMPNKMSPPIPRPFGFPVLISCGRLR